jgi:cell division protein FtsB
VELALAIFNVGAGIGILAVGASVAYLAWRLTPLIAETRALTHDLRRLTRTAEAELRPLLDRAGEVTRSAEVLTDDAAVRVARLAEMVDAMEEIARRPFTATAYPAPVGSVESTETQDEGWER